MADLTSRTADTSAMARRSGAWTPKATVPVGVVLLNWNGHHDTVACLESLVASTVHPARVVVVDNGSAPESVSAILAWAADHGVPTERRMAAQAAAPSQPLSAWLTILCSATNRGFSGGNNLGLALLERDSLIDHFFLLNNDATVAPDFLEIALETARSFPRVGIVTGTIYDTNRPPRLWYAGGRSIPWRALVTHVTTPPASDEPTQTEFISGCAMLISRSAFDAVGPLPECYHPAYMEDAEYTHRVQAAGMATLYAPRAVVYHKIGATLGAAEVRPNVAFAQNRHRAFFVRRNLTGWRRFAALGYLAVTKPGRAAIELARGRPRIGWAILSGTLAGLFSACD